jgi:phosphoribosyl 1,2-cyclic phosphate phosphodiesterase
LKITFLGTGTSHGVPMIGCDCAVCRSDDPRDARLRASLFVEAGDGTAVLVDTGPDLRTQALARGVRRVDAVLFTHSHADHIMGLDEVRRFNHLQRRGVPCYGDARTLDDIRHTFAYAFAPGVEKGGGIPDLQLFTIEGPFCLGALEVVPVPVLHGTRPILGYRFGRFAYLTDCSAIPQASLPLLQDLEVLVIDALRIRPHPTHFSLDEAMTVARALGPRQTYFTHICHDLGHEATCRRLPPGMQLAYDGLVLSLDDPPVNPEGRTDNADFRAPSPERRIASAEPRAPSPESRAPSAERPTPRPNQPW